MTTLPTDAERAQARAEHLVAVADCFELERDGEQQVVAVRSEQLLAVLPGYRYAPDDDELTSLADLDEARAIRDRFAELIEDAERGDELTPDESSRQDDIEAGFDLRDLDREAPR